MMKSPQVINSALCFETRPEAGPLYSNDVPMMQWGCTELDKRAQSAPVYVAGHGLDSVGERD
jgi:hypothetical protein